MCLEKSPQECKLVITTITVELHHYKPSGFFFLRRNLLVKRTQTHGERHTQDLCFGAGERILHIKKYTFLDFLHTYIHVHIINTSIHTEKNLLLGSLDFSNSC